MSSSPSAASATACPSSSSPTSWPASPPAAPLVLTQGGQAQVRRHRGPHPRAARVRGLHGAGPAPHPGHLRQTGGRPPHVRRVLDLHPAQGQPVRRDPDHLRQLAALHPDPAGQRHPVDGVPHLRQQPDHPHEPRLRASRTGSSSSPSPSSTSTWPSTRTSRPTSSASRAATSPASGPARPPSATWRASSTASPFPAACTWPWWPCCRRCSWRLWHIQGYPFYGTTLLIAVGVSLETMRQIDSQLMMRNYEGFLK